MRRLHYSLWNIAMMCTGTVLQASEWLYVGCHFSSTPSHHWFIQRWLHADSQNAERWTVAQYADSYCYIFL